MNTKTLLVGMALLLCPFAAAHAAPPAESAPPLKHAPAPPKAPPGMVWIPSGRFWMGCADCNMPDALPQHLVEVDGFFIDETPVTNAQFAEFVRATGYVTLAERTPDAKDYPGVPADKLVAGSAVFTPPKKDVTLDDPSQWWHYVPGADWRHPEGPGSNLKGREQHPVVHVAYADALAYAQWKGRRLPTEAEFEFAARGGLDRAAYAWGNTLRPRGRWMANIWQGKFPTHNSASDGHAGTSAVRSFPPNGYGLYDMSGNVWQWCADWYRPDAYTRDAQAALTRNPQGPADSDDPDEPGIAKRVQRGGSFLCSDQYCTRYLVGSRGKGAIDSGGSNIGFRTVLSAPQKENP